MHPYPQSAKIRFAGYIKNVDFEGQNAFCYIVKQEVSGHLPNALRSLKLPNSPPGIFYLLVGWEKNPVVCGLGFVVCGLAFFLSVGVCGLGFVVCALAFLV